MQPGPGHSLALIARACSLALLTRRALSSFLRYVHKLARIRCVPQRSEERTGGCIDCRMNTPLPAPVRGLVTRRARSSFLRYVHKLVARPCNRGRSGNPAGPAAPAGRLAMSPQAGACNRQLVTRFSQYLPLYPGPRSCSEAPDLPAAPGAAGRTQQK